jgi:hypothetical protein
MYNVQRLYILFGVASSYIKSFIDGVGFRLSRDWLLRLSEVPDSLKIYRRGITSSSSGPGSGLYMWSCEGFTEHGL